MLLLIDQPVHVMFTSFDRCNSGPGGYRQDYEVTCAVCTPDTKRKGVTYTHWGRPDCPKQDGLVYSGFAAGSYRAHSGSGKAVTFTSWSNLKCSFIGANALCMRKLAKYNDYNAGNHYGAQLYGYEFNQWVLGLYGNYQDVNHQEVPYVWCIALVLALLLITISTAQ